MVMRPVTRASPAVRAAARPDPAASPPTTTPESAAVADIGPTTRWRELPNAAYSTSAGRRRPQTHYRRYPGEHGVGE